MLVGETYSGKTSCINVLSKALTSLSQTNKLYESVISYTLNPKAVEQGQLYGCFDPVSYEWTDGVLPWIVRKCVSESPPGQRQWIIFDG